MKFDWSIVPVITVIAACGGCATSWATHPHERIDADRPHVGTGTHLIPPGEVQFEIGGQFQSFDNGYSAGSPILARVGVSDSFEARVSSDGVVSRSEQASGASGLGNVQIGGKVRLWGKGDEPWLSVMPTVTFGIASAQKRLGSGDHDATVVLLAGRDLTERAHVEANYGIGTIGGGDNGSRFTQHLVTAAVTHQTTPALTTYVEQAWWSRQEPGRGAVSFVDFGVIYAAAPWLFVDGGAYVGVTSATSTYGLFAGLSFAVGEARSRTSRQRATSTFRSGQDRD